MKSDSDAIRILKGNRRLSDGGAPVPGFGPATSGEGWAGCGRMRPVDAVRTPDERFAGLPGHPFAPHYVEVEGLRIHHLDEGDPRRPVALLLHGEPSWCYLYRRMVEPLVGAGLRVVAPDLVGFGRSDKPVDRLDYTYARHVAWMRGLVEALDLRDITLVCQDWGGLIGLRLAAEAQERFSRIVAANTFLPTGDQRMPDAFFAWRDYSQSTPEFHAGGIVRGGCKRPLAEGVEAAYDAPFPDERHLAGARQFPTLVPASPEDPAAPANRAAWEVLTRWEKPFLCAFSDGDPITAGGDRAFRKLVPGTRGQPEVVIRDAGHFLQEDAGEELAAEVAAFVERTA